MDIINRVKNKVYSINKKVYTRIEENYCILKLENHPKTRLVFSENIEMSEGVMDDIEKLAFANKDLFGSKKTARFKARIKKEQKLILSKIDGEIAGYGWHAFKEAPLAVGETIPLDSSSAFIYDFHTLSNYRKRGLFKFFMYTSLTFLKSEGYKEAYVNYLSDNLIAKRLFLNLGFIKQKKSILLNVCGRKNIKTINYGK